MTVYSETVVWSPPPELADRVPYQLVLVTADDGSRIMGRMSGSDRVQIGDTVSLDAVVDGISLFRKTT